MGAATHSLEALLLLALPLLLTLHQFVVLPALGVRSHQLLRLRYTENNLRELSTAQKLGIFVPTFEQYFFFIQ